MDVCNTSMPIHESKFSVVNYTKNGNWDWDRLRGWFSQDVCAKLAVIKPPNPGGHDFPCWNLTSDGDFTLKSAYTLVHEMHAEPTETFGLYDLAWAWQGPQRYRAFIWKLAHGRLFTNEERMTCGMTADSSCARCSDGPESVMHILRDCEQVFDFWKAVVHPDHISRFFSLGFHSWLEWNLTTSGIGCIDSNWSIYFGVAIYELWKDRNSFVFSRLASLGANLLFIVLQETKFIEEQRIKPSLHCTFKEKRLVHIAWTPPPPGCFKFNIDGSHLRSAGSSACGGLVRDSDGRFVKGFYCRVGSGNAIWAELWGL